MFKRSALREILRRWRCRFESSRFHGARRFQHQAINGECRKFEHHPSSQFLPLPSGKPPHVALDFRYVHVPMLRLGPTMRQVEGRGRSARSVRGQDFWYEMFGEKKPLMGSNQSADPYVTPPADRLRNKLWSLLIRRPRSADSNHLKVQAISRSHWITPLGKSR